MPEATGNLLGVCGCTLQPGRDQSCIYRRRCEGKTRLLRQRSPRKRGVGLVTQHASCYYRCQVLRGRGHGRAETKELQLTPLSVREVLIVDHPGD